jgi:hypothetical protein
MAESFAHRVAIGRYLRAVWEDGIARMGATLGILFSFGAAYYGFVAAHNIAFLWLMALLAFLFAGYRVWLGEHRKNIETQGRPKLTGFFQGFQVYSYGEPREQPTEDGRAIIMIPGFENPDGVEVILKFRMVNENPTPTTVHNFNLRMTYYDQEGLAEHADEWVYAGMSKEERAILFEQNEARFADNEDAEKRCPNLVSYLRAHEMVQGKALEGGLVFRFPGIKFVEGRVGDKPTLVLKLGIEDAWGFVHFVESWGKKPPPPPRRVTPGLWH